MFVVFADSFLSVAQYVCNIYNLSFSFLQVLSLVCLMLCAFSFYTWSRHPKVIKMRQIFLYLWMLKNRTFFLHFFFLLNYCLFSIRLLLFAINFWLLFLISLINKTSFSANFTCTFNESMIEKEFSQQTSPLLVYRLV